MKIKSLFPLLIIILLVSCQKQDLRQIASMNSGVEIPENSECLYVKHYNPPVPIESGYDFMYRIDLKDNAAFCKKLEVANYIHFSDTSIAVCNIPMGHAVTLKNGYRRYVSTTMYYFYDTDSRLFYIKHIYF